MRVYGTNSINTFLTKKTILINKYCFFLLKKRLLSNYPIIRKQMNKPLLSNELYLKLKLLNNSSEFQQSNSLIVLFDQHFNINVFFQWRFLYDLSSGLASLTHPVHPTAFTVSFILRILIFVS